MGSALPRVAKIWSNKDRRCAIWITLCQKPGQQHVFPAASAKHAQAELTDPIKYSCLVTTPRSRVAHTDASTLFKHFSRCCKQYRRPAFLGFSVWRPVFCCFTFCVSAFSSVNTLRSFQVILRCRLDASLVYLIFDPKRHRSPGSTFHLAGTSESRQMSRATCETARSCSGSAVNSLKRPMSLYRTARLCSNKLCWPNRWTVEGSDSGFDASGTYTVLKALGTEV